MGEVVGWRISLSGGARWCGSNGWSAFSSKAPMLDGRYPSCGNSAWIDCPGDLGTRRCQGAALRVQYLAVRSFQGYYRRSDRWQRSAPTRNRYRAHIIKLELVN